MLLAVGFALGGYCILVAFVRSGDGVGWLPAPDAARLSLPDPQRLVPVTESRRFAVPASSPRETAQPFVVTFVVRGVPEALRAGGGIAIARADKQGGWGWLPWQPQGEQAAMAIEVKGQFDAPGHYSVSVASDRAFGIHGYLARREFLCTEAASVEIDASATAVTFRLGNLAQSVGPLQVVRVDDPNWLPVAALPTGLTLAPGTPARVWLGHGTYEIFDPLRPNRRQTVRIPDQRDVVLNADLARPPDDRP